MRAAARVAKARAETTLNCIFFALSVILSTGDCSSEESG